MRRFVALSLSFFILVNCFDIKSSASFVNIKPTMSPDSDDIVSVSYIKPTQQDMPYFDDTMSSFCIGLIKFELENPQKFMPNVKVNIKVSPPPSVSRIAWNKFKDAIWPISHAFITLGVAIVGGGVGTLLGRWKYNVDIMQGSPESDAISNGGVFLGLVTGFLISDSGCSANDFKMSVNSIPFKYSLDPISEQEVKTLQANKVRPGEKKENQKESDKRYEEIRKANGPTFGEAISKGVLIKGYDTLADPDIDQGDPFGLMENAKFLKLDEYKYPRNFENYFSDKESKAVNKQNAMKKSQFCKNHSDDQEGINVSNYSNKILATLSRDNPVQYAAIMVNDSVEAAKLRKLLERSYSATSQLVYRLKNSFSTKLVLSLPDGSTADEDTEKKAEIALGSGPSWPACIVSFFVPHGIARYISSLVDWAWKGIYDNAAWIAERIKGKFFIKKENPPWVVLEVEPGVDPPWTIPQQIQQNQQQLQNPYNNGPNCYDPSAANGQAQHQGNQPPQQGGQQQQNNQPPPSDQQQSTQRLSMYDEPIIDRDSVIAKYNNNNDDDNSSASEANETDKSEINSDDNKNNEEWEEPTPVTEIDLNAIPQGKNRDRNSSRNSTQSVFLKQMTENK